MLCRNKLDQISHAFLLMIYSRCFLFSFGLIFIESISYTPDDKRSFQFALYIIVVFLANSDIYWK